MIPPLMPSPIGHALGGLAAAWAADLVPGDRAWRRHDSQLTILCGALGVAPDLDLIVGGHRTATHSIGAVVMVAAGAGVIAAWTRRPVMRVALMCAAAYATHLVLDWLAVDPSAPYGIQAFWPFSDHWYISGVDLFLATERRMLISSRSLAVNAAAVAREVIVLGPVTLALWLIRVKAVTGFSAEVPRRDHAPQ